MIPSWRCAIGTVFLALTIWSPIFAGCMVSNDNPNAKMLWGYALHGYPISKQQINEAETTAGIRSNIILFYLQWPEDPANPAITFPQSSVRTIRQHGALPCISWEPMYLRNGKEHAILAETILAGEYDKYLRSFARSAREWEHPILLRFAHEMNINRYHWGVRKENYGPRSPALYRRMYRHVASIFHEVGADNVGFVWCPNAESVPDTSSDNSSGWNTAENYYPGSKFVDIVGMDGYNWGTTRKQTEHGWTSHWQSAEDIFGDLYRTINTFAPDKPIIICEFASARAGGNRKEWVSRTISTFAQCEVDGAVWFQANSELDWRLEANQIDSESVIQPLSPEQTSAWIKDILHGKK